MQTTSLILQIIAPQYTAKSCNASCREETCYTGEQSVPSASFHSSPSHCLTQHCKIVQSQMQRGAMLCRWAMYCQPQYLPPPVIASQKIAKLYKASCREYHGHSSPLSNSHCLTEHGKILQCLLQRGAMLHRLVVYTVNILPSLLQSLLHRMLQNSAMSYAERRDVTQVMIMFNKPYSILHSLNQ